MNGRVSTIIITAIITVIISVFSLYMGHVLSDRSLGNYILGGDSFCFFELKNKNQTSREVELVLNHEGEYPLYDLDAFLYYSDKNGNYSDRPNRHIEVEGFAPNTTWRYTLNLKDRKANDIKVRFFARNGFFEQKIRLVKNQGKWIYATVVERKNEVLYRYSDR